MALTQGTLAQWSDINGLYTTLRSIQSTHGLTQTQNPSGSGQGTSILTTHITPINTALEAMKSETHLRRSSYVGQGTNPTRGELITPAIIATLRTKLDNLRNVCHNNSFDSFDGFNSTFRAAFNASFRASFRANNSFNFSFSDSFGDSAGFSFFAGECTSFGN